MKKLIELYCDQFVAWNIFTSMFNLNWKSHRTILMLAASMLLLSLTWTVTTKMPNVREQMLLEQFSTNEDRTRSDHLDFSREIRTAISGRRRLDESEMSRLRAKRSQYIDDQIAIVQELVGVKTRRRWTAVVMSTLLLMHGTGLVLATRRKRFIQLR